MAHRWFQNHEDRTVSQIWLAEVEVLAGAGRALLCPQREAHALDLLAQCIERAEDLLHTFMSAQELCTHAIGSLSLREHLTGVDGALGLLRELNRQRLDDFTSWSLKRKPNLAALSRCAGLL